MESIAPGGGSIMAAIADLMKMVHTQSGSLRSDIGEATSKRNESGDLELAQEDLLRLQYKMGEYNAMLEAASSISKSVTDMCKTLAQRSG